MLQFSEKEFETYYNAVNYRAVDIDTRKYIAGFIFCKHVHLKADQLFVSNNFIEKLYATLLLSNVNISYSYILHYTTQLKSMYYSDIITHVEEPLKFEDIVNYFNSHIVTEYNVLCVLEPRKFPAFEVLKANVEALKKNIDRNFYSQIDTIKFGIEIEKQVEEELIPDTLEYYHSYGNTALKTDSSCGVEFTSGTETIDKISIIPEMLYDSIKFNNFLKIKGKFPLRNTGTHFHFSIKQGDSEFNPFVIGNNLHVITLLLSPFFGWGRIRNRSINWGDNSLVSHYSVVNIRPKRDIAHYEIRAFASSENTALIAGRTQIALAMLWMSFNKEVSTLAFESLRGIFPETIEKSMDNVKDFETWRETKKGQLIGFISFAQKELYRRKFKFAENIDNGLFFARKAIAENRPF